MAKYPKYSRILAPDGSFIVQKVGDVEPHIIPRRKLQLVATRGAIMGGQALSDNTQSRLETRIKTFFGPSACSEVRLVFTNYEATGSAAEVVGPNSITVEAAIETISPVGFMPVLFDGALSVVIAPGATVISDPIGYTFPAFSQAWVRTGVTMSVGQQVPTTSFFAISGEGQVKSTNVASQIFGTGILANGASGSTAASGYIPTAIIGVPETPFPAVGVIGDSIAAGTIGDTSSATTGARGIIMRGLWLTTTYVLPYAVLARASEQDAFNVGLNGQRRRVIYPYLTHAIDNGGTNDIAAAASLATMQSQKVQKWTDLKAHNIHVTVLPILPRTNAGNTAPSAGYGTGELRDTYNAWQLSQVGGPLVDAFGSLNDVAEGAHGLWANGAWTADGVHPNAVGTLALEGVTRAVAAGFRVEN